jgi:tetratricopeptide (TPR) repeat protein
MFAGRHDEALAAALSAVSLAQRAADPREETSARRMEGDVLFRQQLLAETERAWATALELARRTGTVDEEAGLLINLGFLELERDNPAAALVHNESAIAAFERMGHGSGIAVGYGNLAWTLLQLGRVDDCLDWCDRATAQAEPIGHLGTLADVAKTRATALFTVGRDDEARTAAREAAEVFERMGLNEERDACLELAQAGVPLTS